jgi:serine/threonine protein kinase
MQPETRVASRYVIERELGQGGMGSVYVARDEKFATAVALKIASASGALHAEFKERFVREARIGGRLGRQTGFVRAFDWGELDGTTLYLAMDLVEKARPLDLRTGTREERLKRLVAGARLVALVHAQGVVHRDVKPQNFLVDDLTLWTIGHTQRYPRSHRGGLGARTDATLYELLETLVEAQRRLTRLRFVLRLATDLRLLPIKSHGHAALCVDELGRMLGGWRRSGADRAPRG